MTQPPRRAAPALPVDVVSRPSRALADGYETDADAPAPRRASRALRALPPDHDRPAGPAHLAASPAAESPATEGLPARAVVTSAARVPSRGATRAASPAVMDPATVAPVLPAFAPDRLAAAARKTPAPEQTHVWTPRGAAPTPPTPRPATQAEPARSAASPTRQTASDAPRQGGGAAPRRGIAPPPRGRRVLPFAAGALAVATAILALVIAGLQGAPGSARALAPTPSSTQIAAIESAAAIPADVTTQYAAGAFAAPETGGVRLTSRTTGPLSGKVIVLDPGHNGGFKSSINNRNYYTFGAGWRPCAALGTTTYTNVTEHTIVWQLANKMAGLLLAQGATVVLTRADDTGYGPCNNERPEIANREGASLFLSLHVDGNDTTTLRGFHLTYSSRMAGGDALTQESAKAAGIVLRHMLQGTALPASNYNQTDGVSIITRTDLAVLDGIRGAPAVLLETGNSRNPDDVALLTSEAGQLSVAQALVAAAIEIVQTLPANTTVGPASPSPAAPAGASVPPTNASPLWETAPASPGNDEAGAEYVPTGTPTTSTTP